MRGHRFIIGFLILCSLPAWAQKPLESREKSLKVYEKRIGKQKARLERLSVQERSLHKELRDFSQRSERVSRDILRLERETRLAETDIEKNTKRIHEMEEEIAKRREGVTQRLRQLYKWGSPSPLRVFLSSQTGAQLRQEHHLIYRWIVHDQEIIGTYRDLIASLRKQRFDLQERKAKRGKLLQHLSRRRLDLDREQKAHKKLLALVKGQRSYYEKSIRELQQAAADLEKLIETLQRQESGSGSRFARMRGRLPYPVRGGRLERRYGPYVDSQTHVELYHKGIDLRAKPNVDILAVFDGKVVYAGWFTGYGKVVILDHGGGYFTLYAHAAVLHKKAQDSVVVGESIGKVGDTGSLKGHYLYFELRRKGISVDPLPWLDRKQF